MDDRARGRGRGRRAGRPRQFADLYAHASPALVRCGWGARAQPQRRQRRRGHPGAAGRRRQVRRPRRRLRDEQLRVVGLHAAVARRTPEPPTRAINMNQLGTRAHRAARPAGEPAVRLQLQPRGDHARPGARAARGSHARTSSPSSSSRCMTDTVLLRRRGAAGDDVPRALRLLARATARSRCS